MREGSDCIVALNKSEESPKEEGALAVVICALCDAFLFIINPIIKWMEIALSSYSAPPRSMSRTPYWPMVMTVTLRR